MLEKFFDEKFNDKVLLVRNGVSNTYGDVKNFVAMYSKILADKKQNVVIFGEDNFSFIVRLFASIFSKKNIYILPDETRLKSLDFDYDILEDFSPQNCPQTFQNTHLEKVCPEEIFINFCTSGSSGNPKIIKKTLQNLISEAHEIKTELNLEENEQMTVKSSATLGHLFGITFHLMLPLCCGFRIDTEAVGFPEDLCEENTIFVSTPTFLKMAEKLELPFEVPPKLIFSAGSKLDEKVFEFLQKNSPVTEIYGSTETGVIAYKTNPAEDFRIFKNVCVKTDGQKTYVTSGHIYGGETEIGDEVEVCGHSLILKNRTDRILKVYEKRVSADELENILSENELVKTSHIFKHKDKIACLCALSDTGKDFLLENSVPKLTKILKQHMRKFSDVIPQKWKFIDEIPMTSSGKIDVDLIRHFFNVNLSLPIILDRGESENCIVYKILFYGQCNFFEGHFPEFKLLPGVVQLYFAKEFANQYFKLNLGAGQWKRIKFSNIIPPDSVVYLKLEKTPKHVAYEYYSEEEKYASGLFLCENIFKEAK